METRLLKLKNNFNNIITIRNSVKNIFDILLVKIGKLKGFYAELIKDRKSEMFVFGLDSFYFQNKLIDIEYDDMKRLFLAINNRMYCEYFKLHKIITDYISKNIIDKKILEMIKVNNYPIYKDLEPFKEYNIEVILDIHESILNLLSVLISTLNNKENELEIHKTKQNIGLNIDNFITTFSFNITVLREKIILFITYIEFFHKMHTKYLKRFNNKIQLMHTHIMNDIKLEESIEMTNEKKAEILNEFNINGADQELLENLKKTINSETSSENGDEIRSKSNSFDIKETKENIVLIKAEPEPEPELEVEQEDTKNNEDNESVVSSEPVKEEPKKKRTYKPRKK
jgi:hypothetical protein